MGKARASIDLPVQVSAAEALWYDVSRWPVFVDGFKAVAKLEGDWPRAGARLVWDSVPAGRGRVVESVTHYEVRRGQTVEVEDEKITGTQSVSFEPQGDGRSRMTLALEWRHKDANALTPVVDLLFVRRAFADALRRTLSRFSREVRVDSELSEGAY
jgi:Polyketide cyclase / dehydrase and lipid transport